MSQGAAQRPASEPFFEPLIVNRRARSIAGPLRVTLFNAQGLTEVEKIAQCLSRPPLSRSSILLLCEADWGTHRSGQRETVRELAEKLQMSFAYMPEFGIPQKDGTHQSFLGNAILSTTPFDEVRGVAYPMPIVEGASPILKRRVGSPAGLVCRFTFGKRDVQVGVVHLASHCDPQSRDEQMAAYMAQYPAEGPAILGGDLNSVTTQLLSGRAYLETMVRMLLMPWRFHSPQRYEPLFKRLTAAGLQIDGVNRMRKSTYTFGRIVPPLFRPKLDWLAVRDLKPVKKSAAVIPARPSFFSRRVSDHDFVTAEIEV
jgi:endonuclease/exonuclease/phosphatase family metal-dependent hydrolase